MANELKLLDEARDMRNKKANLSAALEKVNAILEQNSDFVPALLFKSIVVRDLGLTQEARAILKHILAEINAKDLVHKADAERLLGFLELLQGNVAQAQVLAEQAHATALASGSQEMLANTFALLGNIAHTNNQLQQAREYYHNGLTVAQKARFVEREITVTINLATALYESGELDEGLKLLDAIIKRAEAKWSKALFNAYYERTKLHRIEQQVTDEVVERAIYAYKQATAHGWCDEQGNLARELGLLYKSQGDMDQAQEYFEISKKVFSEAGIQHKVSLVEGDEQD